MEELRALLRGRPAATIFSNRSPTVNKLDLNPTLLSDEELLGLMARHPTLIRRPLLEQGQELVVGLDRKAYSEQLKGE